MKAFSETETVQNRRKLVKDEYRHCHGQNPVANGNNYKKER